MPAPGELLESREREAARSLSPLRRLTGRRLRVGSFVLLVAFGPYTGITADLGRAGKRIIAFLMFMGRVGPPTRAGSMVAAARRARARFRYATEDVIID
ncbi:MAG TPA: hypothetical protein VF158_15755 [Longimicrobiales bacterium]